MKKKVLNFVKECDICQGLKYLAASLGVCCKYTSHDLGWKSWW